MAGRIYFLFSVVVLVGCAKPNYQDAQPIELESKNKPAAGSCELMFEAQQLCVRMTWETQPTQTDFGSFTFEFYKPAAPQVFEAPPSEPFVQLWMPDMGHGSSPVTVERLSEGKYRASKVSFFMKGKWDIRLQFKDGKNVVGQVVKSVEVTF